MLPQGPILQATVLLLICAASFTTGSHAGSVSFLESKPGSYLRAAPSNSVQGRTFSHADVSDAISVLLGSAPSSDNDETASKLNELLVPNPFNRPQAVLLLNIEESKPGAVKVISTQHHDLQLGSSVAELSVPDYTTFVSLNTTSNEFHESSDVDTDMKNLVSFLGGSYTSDGNQKGTLSFTIDEETISVNLAKEAERKFAFELNSIVQHAKSAAVVLDNVRGGFISGSLPSMKSLYEGSEKIMTSYQASKLQSQLAQKLFSFLDTSFNGGLVGVVVDSFEPIMNMKFTWGPSRLQLLESSSDSTTSAIAEVLTETIIAYITGILFVVALIIGTCFLFKMPVTRDTLLYSGAKLD